jgi:hypothetical protein
VRYQTALCPDHIAGAWLNNRLKLASRAKTYIVRRGAGG